jgi:hypothetical protein
MFPSGFEEQPPRVKQQAAKQTDRTNDFNMNGTFLDFFMNNNALPTSLSAGHQFNNER